MEKSKKTFSWKIGESNGVWSNLRIVESKGSLCKILIHNKDTGEEKIGWTTNLTSFLRKKIGQNSSILKFVPIVDEVFLKKDGSLERDNKLTLMEIENFLSQQYLTRLSTIDYGKTIQKAAEDYVCEFSRTLSSKVSLLDLERESSQLKEEYSYYNNGSGFDRLLYPQKKRVQVKFRQVEGKTPFSRQTHFSNTRRHSDKNKGKGDETGTVSYSSQEMDYVLVILCHLKQNDNTFRNYKNWSFSLIPVEELLDVNREGFLLNSIPSETLYKNKCDDIYMLTKKLEEI